MRRKRRRSILEAEQDFWELRGIYRQLNRIPITGICCRENMENKWSDFDRERDGVW
jgi:hypothetical protein